MTALAAGSALKKGPGKRLHVEKRASIGPETPHSTKKGTGQAFVQCLQALRNRGVTKVSQFGTGKSAET